MAFENTILIKLSELKLHSGTSIFKYTLYFQVFFKYTYIKYFRIAHSLAFLSVATSQSVFRKIKKEHHETD